MELYEETLSMSNKEAARVLKRFLHGHSIIGGRGNGKSLTMLLTLQALSKAIDLLEKTPDENK